MEFPKSLSPDPEDLLFEHLSNNINDIKDLEYIRRQMRYIYAEEHKNEARPDVPSTKIS